MPLWCCLKDDEEEAIEEDEAATELLVECQNGSLQRPQILPSDTDFSLASAIVVLSLLGTFWFSGSSSSSTRQFLVGAI